MKSKFIIAIVVLLKVSTINASAQNKRSMRDEKQRIHQGVKSGELTSRETAGLTRKKAQLRKEAIPFKANDGHIGPGERADLRRDNKRLSRNIYLQKRDRQGTH